MSRPAISCARRKHETASSYCSRKRECTIASRKLCDPSTAVYQDGRGSDPMIEVGIVTPADALYIVTSPAVGGSLPAVPVQKSKASLLAGAPCESERSGCGSRSPESRKRFTIG